MRAPPFARSPGPARGVTLSAAGRVPAECRVTPREGRHALVPPLDRPGSVRGRPVGRTGMTASVPAQRLVLPDFLVIGASKGGTHWLNECLREHPDVYLTPDVHE